MNRSAITYIDTDFFAHTLNVKRWRQVLQSHPDVQNAVVEDFPQRLLTFLKQRNSYGSKLILQ